MSFPLSSPSVANLSSFLFPPLSSGPFSLYPRQLLGHSHRELSRPHCRDRGVTRSSGCPRWRGQRVSHKVNRLASQWGKLQRRSERGGAISGGLHLPPRNPFPPPCRYLLPTFQVGLKLGGELILLRLEPQVLLIHSHPPVVQQPAPPFKCRPEGRRQAQGLRPRPLLQFLWLHSRL